MDQSTEPIVTSDAKRGKHRRGWKRSERRCLVQCSVRPVGVEVRHVLGQHNLKLALVEDQHPIQQLAAHGADPAFGDGVRAGRAYWGAQDPDGFAGEHGVEDAGELAVAVRIKNLNPAARSPRSIIRLRACWATQAPVGFAVTPSKCTRRVACSTTNRT